MIDLDLAGWIVVSLAAVMVGIAKTGIPGVGILAVPLMAIVLPEKRSTGVLLGILILADVFAVIYHRHNARWRHVLRLLPATFAGIVTGYLIMGRISNAQLKPIIGAIVLVMLGLSYWRSRRPAAELQVPTHWGFAAVLGFAAGVTTMMANAAGPVMIIYLVAMRLPKVAFVGTSAWFFFIVNWTKVPFSGSLGLMNAESIKLNLMMVPCIAVGAFLGVVALKRIPERAFAVVVQLLAAAAAIKLLF